MMGLCASVSSAQSSPSKSEERSKKKRKAPPKNMGIGMGVAIMMQQAAQLSGAAQHRNYDYANLQNEMRKAKAEGRTVTVINGCVYFDYQLVAQLPAGCEFPL